MYHSAEITVPAPCGSIGCSSQPWPLSPVAPNTPGGCPVAGPACHSQGYEHTSIGNTEIENAAISFVIAAYFKDQGWVAVDTRGKKGLRLASKAVTGE